MLSVGAFLLFATTRSTAPKSAPLVVVSCAPIADAGRRSSARLIATGRLEARDGSYLCAGSEVRVLIPEEDPWYAHFRARSALWDALGNAGDLNSIRLPDGPGGDYVKRVFRHGLPDVEGFDNPSFRFAVYPSFSVSRRGSGESMTWSPKEGTPPLAECLKKAPTASNRAADFFPQDVPDKDETYCYVPDQKLTSEELAKAMAAAMSLYKTERERMRQTSAAGYRKLYTELLEKSKASSLWAFTGRDVGLSETTGEAHTLLNECIDDCAATLGFPTMKAALDALRAPGTMRLEPRIELACQYRDRFGQVTKGSYVLIAPHYEPTKERLIRP